MPKPKMEPNPSPRSVSQRDIAKHLGISHVSVSMALQDNPRVSEKLRKKVQEFALEVGYRPDPMLSALCRYRLDKCDTDAAIHSTIAWINAWPKPNELRSFKEFDCYWKGASAAAAKYGYRLEEFRLGREYTATRLNQILNTRGIRGLLLPPQKIQPKWGNFPWSEYFVVRFGRSLTTPNTHLITADQVANTMLAFDEIRKRGYRRIGLIAEDARIRESGHLFEGGYILAQRKVEEKDSVPVLPLSPFAPNQRGAAIAEWIKNHQVDAIITDVAEVPNLMAKAGIQVPEDVGLAVTSILDTNADSGIDQHPEEIGRVAFLMLNSLINDRAKGIAPIFRQVLVAGSWVDGTSLPTKISGAHSSSI